MSDIFKSNITVSRDNVVYALNKTDLQPTENKLDSGGSYEVFRNNTTAIEVIIKDINNKKKKKNNEKQATFEELAIKTLKADVWRLRTELGDANVNVEKMRYGYQRVIVEMNKQLQIANKRDLDNSSIIVSLQLENEKLKCLLQSKTSLIVKLRRELNSIKKVLKLVIKNLSKLPRCPDIGGISSDSDYDKFEKHLFAEAKEKLVSATLDRTLPTLNTTGTKDSLITSFETQVSNH